MITTRRILKEIGCDKLQLFAGKGYFFFQYDDYEATKTYETKSVIVYRLNQLSFEHWIEEGRDFVEKMKAKRGM